MKEEHRIRGLDKIDYQTVLLGELKNNSCHIDTAKYIIVCSAHDAEMMERSHRNLKIKIKIVVAKSGTSFSAFYTNDNRTTFLKT